MKTRHRIALAAFAASSNLASAQSLGDSKESHALDPAAMATAMAVASLPPPIQASVPSYIGTSINAARRGTKSSATEPASTMSNTAPQLSAQQMAALTAQILKEARRTGTPVVIDIPCTSQRSKTGQRGSTTTFCQVNDVYIVGD